jgi:acetyl esterase
VLTPTTSLDELASAPPEFPGLRAASVWMTSSISPAIIGVAHADPLRDEGPAYARALAASGVDVFARDYKGMIHTFAAMFAISDGADRALMELLGQFSKAVTS